MEEIIMSDPCQPIRDGINALLRIQAETGEREKEQWKEPDNRKPTEEIEERRKLDQEIAKKQEELKKCEEACFRSYRASLTKIGISFETPVSYQSFFSKPKSLRQAMRSMYSHSQWSQISPEISLDEIWTDEVQGVAWDGANWIFSCNANPRKSGVNNKAVYVFKGGSKLLDGNVYFKLDYKDVPHPVAGHESDDHWGQLTCFNGYVYVSHYYPGDSNVPLAGHSYVFVFRNNGGVLSFEKWIELSKVKTSDGEEVYPEFQGINPWDGKLYTAKNPVVHEFFLHDLDGKWTGETFRLNGLLPQEIQGICFSPNGHVYVAVNQRFKRWDEDNKWIFYYSALNGAFLGKIPVLAKESNQELEGLCFADVSYPDGQKALIHVVLLENVGDYTGVKDNIFFKSYSSSTPDLV
jgi:hypothetical protein